MSDKIRWGILSTANIGLEEVAPAIQKAANSEVTAVASRSLDSAKAYADKLGIPKVHGSYEDLLADPDIDAIYNPLPNSLHAGWSIKAAEAGKPTLCEKPLATDAAEALSMVDAFRKQGVLFTEAFMYRFHPQVVRAKELINSGAIGDLKGMASVFTYRLGPGSEDNIRLSAPLAGGGLMDVGCYCINIMRLMAGEEPNDARGTAVYGEESGVDESFSAALRFPSGVVGQFECGMRTYYTNTFEARGTMGQLRMENAFKATSDDNPVIRLWQGDNYEEIIIDPADQYMLMIEDFADAILNNRPPRYSSSDAVANMVVIDWLAVSARNK